MFARFLVNRLFFPVLSAVFVLSSLSLCADTKDRRVTLYDGRGLVAFADTLLGSPYKPGGKDPSGFDCSGFTGYVYKKGGYKLTASSDSQYAFVKKVKVPKEGDLVFFKIDGNKISHVGIYAGNGRFIHAPSSGKAVSYANLEDRYWKEHYAGAGTIFD